MTAILIAEDEERISSFLEKGLRLSGFSTRLTTDGEEALRLARSGRFSLLVLDLDLADGTGVVRELGARPVPLPVIVLTGRRTAHGERRPVEGGALEYVTKPFRFAELVARIRVLLGSREDANPSVLWSGDVALDPYTRRAIVAGRPVQLSAREFDLARVFFRRPGHVVTREELLGEVWGYGFDPGSTIVDVYLGRLRRKLGRDRITSVRRFGYRLETHRGSESGAGPPPGGRGRVLPRPWTRP